MRQTHLGGDKLLVDHAGDTVQVIFDRRSGETRRARLFAAVMRGPHLSFASREADRSQRGEGRRA